VTGLIAGAHPVLYRISLETVFQIWLMVVILAGYTTSRRTLSLNLLALMLGAMWVWFGGVRTGSYQSALTMGTRAKGLAAMDTNEFGWLLIVATVTMAYFWMQPTRFLLVRNTVLACLMTAAGVGIVLSGSRFSILGAIVFYFLWIWVCYRKEVLRRPSVLIVIFLALSLGGAGFIALASRTVAGKRLHKTWMRLTGQTAAGGSAGRIDIYKESVGIISSHAVFGVGLNNFRLHSSSGSVSHSEFTEIASDTGLPGFAIYFSIYLILWRRAGKIIKYSNDPAAVRISKLIRVYIMVMLFVGLGVPHYYNKIAWIMMGGFAGFTRSVWRELKVRLPHMERYPMLAYEGYAA